MQLPLCLATLLFPVLNIAHMVRDTATAPAATLYKSQNLAPGTVPSAQLSIPGSTCVDLNNVFGSWEGQTRSLTVGKGWCCTFYAAYGCPAAGAKLELGDKNAAVSKKTLGEWDRRIMSVYCKAL